MFPETECEAAGDRSCRFLFSNNNAYISHMKKIFLIAIFLQPLVGFCQTKGDCEHVMKRFQGFYNKGLGDSICNMFPARYRESIRKHSWNDKQIVSLKDHYGTMVSYKYIGVDPEEKVHLFKTVFSKSTFMMSFTLDKDTLGTFRLDTRSPYYDSLLKVY